MTDPLFWTVAVLSIFLVALSKAGLPVPGLLGVPVLSIFMSPRDAAGMLLPLLLIMDAIGLIAYRRQIDRAILWIMVPAGLIFGTGLGWITASFISDAMVLLIVGVLTIVFVLDHWLPIRKKIAEKLPPSKPWGWFWGGVAGFTSFVSHTGGPPFQIYVLPRRLAPAIYAGTNAWFFAIINASKVGPYWSLGQFSVSNLWIAAALIPVAIAGMLVGIWAMRRVSADLFYQLTYVLVFAIGLKLTYDGIIEVFFTSPLPA